MNNRLNVVITFNAKPENNSSAASLSPEVSHQDSPVPSTQYDDQFAEWDSWETIHAVEAALATKHHVQLVEATPAALQTLIDKKPDIVFNIAEGYHGISREAQVPALLDMLNIPYSGSDPLTLSICLDKARTKEILSFHNIPNARFINAYSAADVANHQLQYPLIVKPVGEGSGKGIFASSYVEDEQSLLREVERIIAEYKQPALVEEFLSGREFTVAIMGNGKEAKVLPIIEISFAGLPEGTVPMYSYETKWVYDTKEQDLDIHHCPAPVSEELEKRISEICLAAYNVLRCRDWSRIDVRCDKDGNPHIIEINPLPGILPDPADNSCYPKAARTAGYSYNDMLLSVLDAARERYGI
ncbi:MAG: ATP-grasp domain-containing protein [Ignavibacteriales bacterium]|nr:ATP-grasp domain-containing protein [Ignavibacteriales bacterium]